MNPLQYINKIFCTLLFFSAGTKSYSQREIHPLEPMFTYDYALKLFTKNIFSYPRFYAPYFPIDSFKAPIGVKSIISYDFINLFDLGRDEDRKRVYYYDHSTGYLQESYYLRLNKNQTVKDTIGKQLYKYTINSENTIISIKGTYEDSYSKRSKTTNYSTEYVYDNKTENLISHNNTHIFYDSNGDLSHLIIDKDSLNITYKNKNFKSNNLYFKDNLKLFFNTDKRNVDIYETKYHIENKKWNTINQTTLQFSDNHIFFRWGGYSEKREAILLFNESKELEAVHFFEHDNVTRYSENFTSIERRLKRFRGYYNILERQKNNKWTASFFGEFDKKYFRYRTTYRKSSGRKNGRYKIKDNIIYYKKKPFIIYNYKSGLQYDTI